MGWRFFLTMTPPNSNGKHPGGRPSKFTRALAETICERLSEGQSLREIGRDPAMPEPITVRMWVIQGKHPEFSAQYALAREAQADHYFDEIFEIADDGSNDWMERQHRDGSTETVLDQEHVQRSKLRVDTRKWALARMSPKKYGALAAGEVPGVNVSVSVTTMIESLKRVAAHRLAPLGEGITADNGHARS